MRSLASPSRRSSVALVLAVVALFIALGGPASAKHLITGKELKAGTITSREVKNRSLQTADLSRKAIRALTAAPSRSVSAASLEDNAVTTRALAPNAVLTGTIGDGQVMSSDLAPSAVTQDKLAPDSVGQREIRDNGVGASEIADNSIGSGEVIDGSLTARDVATYVSAFTVDFDPLIAGQCQRAPVPVMVAGANVAGNLVVASPRTPWPSTVDYVVNGIGDAATFAIWACNRSSSTVDPPPTTFNYAVFGF
jgi:hypothetical protein